MTAPAPNVTSAALNRSLATASASFERRALVHVRGDGLALFPPRHAERAIEVAGQAQSPADIRTHGRLVSLTAFAAMA
jgi:hypothetical protein